jgi:hypothetical protein
MNSPQPVHTPAHERQEAKAGTLDQDLHKIYEQDRIERMNQDADEDLRYYGH